MSLDPEYQPLCSYCDDRGCENCNFGIHLAQCSGCEDCHPEDYDADASDDTRPRYYRCLCQQPDCVACQAWEEGGEA